MLSHDNLATSALGPRPSALGPRGSRGRAGHDRPTAFALHAAPMLHLADFRLWVSGQLLPTTQVMIPAFDPVAVLSAVQECGVTDALLVPTMIQMTVDGRDGLRRYGPASP